MSKCAPPLSVLIVEDEALLAMDIESMVEDAGHRVIGEIGSTAEFEALRLDERPHIAFVDIQLAAGSSGLDVCRLIQARWVETVIVFVTANPKKIPPDFAGGHGVISKPFSRSGLMSAMRYLEEGICDPPPQVSQPQSFTASPTLKKTWV